MVLKKVERSLERGPLLYTLDPFLLLIMTSEPEPKLVSEAGSGCSGEDDTPDGQQTMLREHPAGDRYRLALDASADEEGGPIPCRTAKDDTFPSIRCMAIRQVVVSVRSPSIRATPLYEQLALASWAELSLSRRHRAPARMRIAFACESGVPGGMACPTVCSRLSRWCVSGSPWSKVSKSKPVGVDRPMSARAAFAVTTIVPINRKRVISTIVRTPSVMAVRRPSPLLYSREFLTIGRE